MASLVNFPMQSELNMTATHWFSPKIFLLFLARSRFADVKNNINIRDGLFGGERNWRKIKVHCGASLYECELI